MKLKEADKKKLFKVACILTVWGVAIAGFGGLLSKTPARSSVAKSVEQTRQEIENDSRISNSAREQKLSSLNLQAVVKGMKNSENALGIADWEKPVSKARDGIPALQVYFPQGEGMEKWNESFVLRSFVNITVPNPYPLVYSVYADWLKTQVSDIQMTSTQDDTGVYFSGRSDSKKLLIAGKIYSGAVKETLHIAQYALKEDCPEARDKSGQWRVKLEKLKP